MPASSSIRHHGDTDIEETQSNSFEEPEDMPDVVLYETDGPIAAEDASFGEPDIQYGSGPVTLLMPFILGQKKTNELLFTGDRINAKEALSAGLINKIVPQGELQTAARKLALRIAPTPLEVLRLTKLTLNRAYEAMGLRTAVQNNVDISALINGANTPEQQEFDKLAAEHGLKAALAWRDQRYGTA